jgi:hypothetical protein
MIELSDPFSRPIHFALLEIFVALSTAAVLAHAVIEYRRGDRRHLFQWIAITSYGIQMELIAFNFLHNYAHAQFTVQLYHGQLPLYVTGLYGAFMYAGIKLAERLEVHPVAEAFLAGFAICLIDVPFDIAGVAVGWWDWLDTDPNLAFRWLGVPVTSYEWYLIFGAVAAAQLRLLWPRLEKRSFALAAIVALFAGSGVVFFGVLGFLPFHGIKALGVSDGMIVAAHLAICAVLALAVRGRRGSLSPLIAGVVLLLGAFHVALLSWLAVTGALPDGIERASWSAFAFAGSIAFVSFLPFRRVQPAPTLQLSNS